MRPVKRVPGGGGGPGSGQGADPVGDVCEPAVVPPYPGEEFPGPGVGARPLVQVGQGVGPSQVVVPWTGWDLPALLQEADRLGQSTLVGDRSGGHQTTLGHQRGAGRGVTELYPECVHVVPPALGTVAVGQHGMLLGAPGQLPEGLQSLRTGPPVTHPVVHQAQELEHLGYLVRPLHELVEDPPSILEALVSECPGSLLEAPQGTATGTVPERPTEQDVGVGQSDRGVGKGDPRQGPG